MREALETVPMRLVGKCLKTNHFHVIYWPTETVDAVADDLVCATLSSALQGKWSRLAETYYSARGLE